VLSLYGNSLTDIPNCVCELTNLAELSLFSNKITALNPKMRALSKLKKWGVSFCPMVLNLPKTKHFMSTDKESTFERPCAA
jgi:Leucine-rich repeat (LRR) protein